MKLPSFPATSGAAWADRLALLCIALMLALPLQHPHHFLPIPSFFTEWWAALFGLGAVACVFMRPGTWQAMPLPRVLLLPALLIAALVVQVIRGQPFFAEQALIVAAYLLWASALVCVGADLARRRGLEWLADGMAAALLLGSLTEAAIMVLQAQQIGYGSGLIFPRQGLLYGNAGQPNHLNDYLWQGVASACYLHLRGRIALHWLLLALGTLLIASAMTTSRSILIYAAALGGAWWLLCRQSATRTGDLRRMALIGAALLPASVALLFLCREATPYLLSQAPLQADTLQRFYAETSSNNIRLLLWREAWQAALSAPWLGQGVGAVPWQYFTQASLWPAGQAAPVAEHAHNLPLQLMAEYGVPVALTVLALFTHWAVAFFRRPLTSARCWLLILVVIATLHSLLEYPLWYTFFLGPFALLLGAADEGRLRLAAGRRGQIYGAGFVVLGFAILGVLRHDYGDMERILNWRVLNGGRLEMKAAVDRMLQLQRNSLLAPEATVSFALLAEPVRDHLEERRALCQSAMHFTPTDRLVFKCALLDAMAGDPNAALHARQAMAAYPQTTPYFRKELDKLSGVTPEIKALFR